MQTQSISAATYKRLLPAAHALDMSTLLLLAEGLKRLCVKQLSSPLSSPLRSTTSSITIITEIVISSNKGSNVCKSNSRSATNSLYASLSFKEPIYVCSAVIKVESLLYNVPVGAYNIIVKLEFVSYRAYNPNFIS